MNDIDLSATAPSSIKTNTSYWDNRLRVWNPAKTFAYRLRSSALLADRDLNLPLLTGTDEIAVLLLPQEFQQKTFNVNLNTLRNTSNSIGQLLVGDGTKYLPLNMGSTAGDVLKINSGVNGLEWGTPAGGGGGGETNTASNVGTAGVGVFKQKSGFNLEFKKLNTASGGLITITDDTANSEVDLKITAGTNGQLLTTSGGVATWAAPSGSATPMPDGTSYSGTRWGRWMGGAGNGDGIFAGSYVVGTTTSDNGSAISRTVFTTPATDAEVAGWQTWTKMTRGSQTPRYKTKFSTSPATERTWVGFINQDDYPGGANPLINNHGLMCGFGESDSNFLIKWNNGGASPQSAATAVAKDAAFHTVELLIDSATSSVSAWFDTVNVVNASTTQIPTLTTSIGVHNYVQAVGATASDIRTEYAMLTYP